MEELSSNRKYQYGKIPQLQSNGTQVKHNNTMGNGTLGKTGHTSENGTLGRTCKVSLVSLKRVGSAISFTPSRKSSAKSVTSKASNESNKSQIRKNSGQFDGCTARVRKHSTGRKVSTSSQSRKVSTNSQRDQIIAEIYRELEQLKEFEFSSSSDDDDDDNNNICDREDLERQKRVETYIKEHRHIYKKIHCDSEAGSTHNNNMNSNDDDEGLSMVVNNSYNIDSTRSDANYEPVSEASQMPAPIIKVEREKKRSSTITSDTDDGYFSTHAQMTSNRLTNLFLDTDYRGVNFNDTFHIVPKVKEKHNMMQTKSGINPKLFHYLQVPEEGPPVDFYRGSNVARGSFNSVSSFNSTISNADSVPMNFIPGQTKPVPRQNRSNSLSLNYIEKAKFCFKGIMCQVDRNTPKTFKAMAHAGMLSISIIGPSEHKCSH